jgi:hypothetical protein
MSEQRTIELHEAAVAAVQARRVPEEILAPGFRMENRVSAVTDYSYHGAMGWRDWMNDVFEFFVDGADYAVEELIAASEDFVVALFCIAGIGALTKMPLEFRWAGVTWFRDGKAIRAAGYPTRREALQAVGLDQAGRPLEASDQPG